MLSSPVLPRPDVLFEDETCWILNKPSGLPSVPGKGPWALDSLAQRAQAHWPDAQVVHRLDMPTSGLMLMARGAHWQRHYSLMFAQRRMNKDYEAIVHGVMATTQGEIDLPLIADWPNRPRQMVCTSTGKPSLTRWSVLSLQPETQSSRLTLQPLTGRSHQLRVHLMSVGHPIWGDTLYAPEPIQALSPRLLLHARSLSFVHPLQGETIRLNCPTPF